MIIRVRIFIRRRLLLYALFMILMPYYLSGCSSGDISSSLTTDDGIIVGAERTEDYFPYLENKRLAILANQTSLVKDVPLLDTLINAGFDVRKVFSPEHSYRGKMEAGKKYDSYIDEKTGVPIISLYGKNYKPADSTLADVDILIFDIQDVGARFYTYISTMSYAMEACAENDVEFMILDRPNPNGFYVDGPVLEQEYSSFVGLHTVPIVHGMTVAEYAQMVNGEGWLKDGIICELKIVKIDNYDHKKLYKVPVQPSPNLPNMTSIYLYPSLCLFEGTKISIGRGTDKPFQVIGYPGNIDTSFSFIPLSIKGVSLNPKFEGIKCYGYDLSDYSVADQKDSMKIDLSWLIKFYDNYEPKDQFFTSYFNKLAGNSTLQEQIKLGKSIKDIRASWQTKLEEFKELRGKYLLY